jgi:hypothetical protein
MVRTPRRALGQLRRNLASIGATTLAGINAPAPPSPLNVDIGPHRRYTFVDADLALFKSIKDSLGGTLNDVVLASVSLALGRWLRRGGHDTAGLVLKAMVPVSVRADKRQDSHPPALGNRVAAMWAPLPVGVEDPAECLEQIRLAMENLKRSGQAVGAQALTDLAGFAPPTILSQAARLQARQRYFNLVVTNVPGPQFPLYLLGRRLRSLYPVVPLARRQALGIAVMSYNGHLGFGLLGDYDALPDLDAIALDLEHSVRLLARSAHVPRTPRASRGKGAKTSSARADGAKTSSARADGAKTSSARADGTKTSTARADGTKTSAAKADGAKTSAARAGAAKASKPRTGARRAAGAKGRAGASAKPKPIAAPRTASKAGAERNGQAPAAKAPAKPRTRTTQDKAAPAKR